jgi:hypothetical protein
MTPKFLGIAKGHLALKTPDNRLWMELLLLYFIGLPWASLNSLVSRAEECGMLEECFLF